MTRARWSLGLLLVACTPHEHPQEPQVDCVRGMARIEGDAATPSFCIDLQEVTTREFAGCVSAGQCTPPLAAGGACNVTRAGRGEHPVNCVSAEQAQAYCGWLGKRLPSDVEWSWARTGARKGYPWGEAAPDATRACMQRGEAGTCAVGGRPAGNSPEGVGDLIGNVEEWVLAGERAVLRGGSWADAFGAAPMERDVASPQSGVRCAVALRASVQEAPTDEFVPLPATPVDLPVLAAWKDTDAPTRPLAHLSVLHHGSGGGWHWPVGDGFLETGAGVGDTLGLRDGLDVAGLPEALREFSPMQDLGSTVLMRAGAGVRLHLIALERESRKIRWQAALGAIGNSYQQVVAPRTVVVEFFGDKEDQLVAFALDSGREVWRLRGGAGAAFTRIEVMWPEGERVLALGDRGLFAFDSVTGAIVWSGVAVGEGCGFTTGEGTLVVEDPAGHRVYDQATGKQTDQVATRAKECAWRYSVWDGGVAGPEIEGGALVMFDPVLRSVDLKTGQERWRREGFGGKVLAADHDAVFVDRMGDVVVGLDAATGATRTEISVGSPFTLEVVPGGGPAGPLVVAFADETWVLGRALERPAPTSYTIRGRLVGEDFTRRRVGGVSVRVGEKRVKTDAEGRFEVKGKAIGAVAVTLGNDRPPWEPGGSRVRFDPVVVVLDEKTQYSVGDLALYEWTAG